MVRHYKKKCLEDMMAAMEAVREAHMTVQGAVRQFSVPKTSLQCRLSGEVNVNARTG